MCAAAQGEGFYYIPGANTCVRIGGYAWAEGYYSTYTDYPLQNDKTYSSPPPASSSMPGPRPTTACCAPISRRGSAGAADPWSDGPTGSEQEVWNIYVQFAGHLPSATPSRCLRFLRQRQRARHRSGDHRRRHPHQSHRLHLRVHQGPQHHRVVRGCVGAARRHPGVGPRDLFHGRFPGRADLAGDRCQPEV